MDSQKSAPPPETKLHFLDYWRIIRIRKTVILAVFLLVVLTTTAITFLLPESYMSTVRIEVGKDMPDIAPLLYGAQHQSSIDPFFIQTEFEKIKSKGVLHKVIEELNLNDTWAKRYGAQGRLRTSETYEILRKHVDVRQSRNTSLIEIRVYSRDKEEAAIIANKIADAYQNLRLESKMVAAEMGIKALNEQWEMQDAKVRAAQQEVDEWRMTLKVADIDMGGVHSTIEQEIVRNRQRSLTEMQSQWVQLNTTLEELQRLEREALRHTIPRVMPDALLNELLSQYASTQNEFAQVMGELGDQHPQIRVLREKLKDLDKQIDHGVDGFMYALQTRVTAFKATADSLAHELDAAREHEAKMSQEYRPYFTARRDLQTQERIRETIMLRILQETVDKSLPKTSMVTVVDLAEPGARPVKPNWKLNIVLGVLVGIMMGVGLAFFIEYLDTSVKTIDDVERALQAPVLGVIPQNVGALIHEGPDSPHAEAYRVLRTNLLFSRKDPKWNSLTVVSGGAGEGKSTTIFNLATVFAQHGDRVLIVDSDLRRPSLHKFLEVSNAVGLTNFLLKQSSLEEVIQTTTVPTLHFLPSGKLPSSSLGILNSSQMREFIQKVKERYDFVFFDSPPIMGVSDASILASSVEMSLLVIQYRKYPQAMTLRAKQMVEKVGGHLLGVVLNNINISQDSYYYYYSGYYYDYYSKQEEEAPAAKKNGETKKAGDRGGLEVKPKY